jgi:valyl-tRNA synthetase
LTTATIATELQPVVDERWVDDTAVSLGEIMLEIATAVRRYKSEHNLSLGAKQPACICPQRMKGWRREADILSISRTQAMFFNQKSADVDVVVEGDGRYVIALENKNQAPNRAGAQCYH